ncbi:Bifunctional chorismate mutase/prephenate dehydratase [Geodia barretti]|uniref:Bifunctional chorismate mutase/prephenate dehydratase n=1 Tax=Geodia barretti TaxID=519541 RepID=A0AA35XMI7_GEOBA|nr:Bifunctional chorismate mutase/prephenate dehydratase [Geodia barretti]
MGERIGYLGPAGTYTEQAALLYAPEAEFTPLPTINAVGAGVANGDLDAGVVPIENSLEGSVTFTQDLLITQTGLSIRNEVVIPIDHFLVAPPGVEADQVRVIFSHPQALAQCRAYLESRFPLAQNEASLSTAAAVADMQGSSVPAAAICPQRATELYDVQVLDRGIQDNPINQTRFAVLARTDHAMTGHDRTSICFSFTVDRPGSLYHCIGEFAQRNINLVKIEKPSHQTGAGALHIPDRFGWPPPGNGRSGGFGGSEAKGRHVEDPGFLPDVGTATRLNRRQNAPISKTGPLGSRSYFGHHALRACRPR